MRQRSPLLVAGPLVASLLAGVHAAAGAKVALCHRPPGNPAIAQTILVGEGSVPAHLDHGDAVGACGAVCSAGQHDCGGTCVSDDSTDTCGTSCTPCSAPANSTATCDGTACGLACMAGHHDCGGACVSNNSTASCGASCTPCAAPPGATATCDGTACDIICSGTAVECGGQCVNPLTDPNNCGRCGNVCSTFCSGGYCY